MIGKVVGQENDTYDEVMLKYITSIERGAIKPTQKDENGMSIKPDKTTTHIGTSNGIWKSNTYHPNYIQ